MIVFIVVFVNFNWQHAIVVLSSLPFLVAFKLYCWKYLDPKIDYYLPHSDNADPETPPIALQRDNGRDKLRNRYGHPAWTQQLITPMVHAKAHHLLPTVYHGRRGLQGEYTGSPSNYGQTTAGIGKVEVVAENDLDYEHFRVCLLFIDLTNARIVPTLMLRV